MKKIITFSQWIFVFLEEYIVWNMGEAFETFLSSLTDQGLCQTPEWLGCRQRLSHSWIGSGP